MPTHVSGGATLTSVAVWVLIIAMVVVRNLRPRRLRVELLWVWPSVILLLIAGYFFRFPPKGLADVVGLIVGFMIGAALGWWRGGFTRIEVDPATGTAIAQASPLGVLIIVALFAVRTGVRYAVAQSGPMLPASVESVTGWLLALAVGLRVVQQLEIWLRARRLMAEAKTKAKAA
jgi:hypothetical protein